MNIPLFKVNFPEDIASNVSKYVLRENIDIGSTVSAFELSLEKYLNTKNVVAINDFSCAMYMALKACSGKKRDEVIISPMVCLAVAMPILWANLKAVWCDINPLTTSFDIEYLKSKITDKTCAIVVSHWNGYPSDIKSIYKLVEGYDIKIIEDGSNAFGACAGDALVGSNLYSDFSVLSFHPTKHFTTIRGAALIVKDDEEYGKIKLTRRFSIDRSKFRMQNGNLNADYDIQSVGYSFYMNEVEASIGLDQLAKIGGILDKYTLNGLMYDSILKDNKSISIFTYDGTASYWTYSFMAGNRDKMVEWLAQNGVRSQRLHVRCDRYTAFANKVELPGVDKIDKENISVPCGWWVLEEDVKNITNLITDYTNVS